MELTSGVLIQALGLCCGEEPEGLGEAVALTRMRQHSFAATLFSAWEAEGRKLNPALRYELEVQRRRIAAFRDTAAELNLAMPTSISLKGLQVGDHYPAGWVRYMNDLDYAAPAEGELWRGVDMLRGAGWELHSGTFVTSGGRLHILISLRHPDEDEYTLPRGVEISTFTAVGDLGGVPMLLDLPPQWRNPVVKNLIMLFYERFEQDYRARDLLDGALLLNAATPRELDSLWTAVDQLGLWPEYAELAQLLPEAGFGSAPAPPRPVETLVAACRRRRRARQFSLLRQPAEGVLRHLQRRLVRGSLSQPERWAWQATEGRIPAGWALRSGLLTFGLPVDGGPRGLTTARVGERDGVTWVDTPAGRFLLATGDELSESAFDALPDDSEPADTEPHTERHTEPDTAVTAGPGR